MQKNLLTVLLSLFSLLAIANGDPNEDKKKGGKTPTVAKPASVLAAPRLQSALNNALRSKVDRLNSVIVPVDLIDNIPLNVSATAEDDRSTARSLMSYLDQNPDKFREDITFEDLTSLPVGVQKRLPDNSIMSMGIYEVKFKPQYAELKIFIRLKTPSNSDNSTVKERDLFFGVEEVRITRQGGFSASGFKAVLLGDYLLPSKDWVVKLRGGIDASVNPTYEDTQRCYIDFDCGEFKEINLVADIVIPRDKLVPCDGNGEVLPAPNRVTVTGSRLTLTNGIRDIVFETGNITPFTLPQHQEYAFIVTGLAFDLSDVKGPNSIAAFPIGYQGDTDEKWQGLYVRNFEVLLPSEFADQQNNGNRISIGAEHVFWDRTGFSGLIYIEDLDKKVDAAKWTLSLNDFSLSFLQNKFRFGSFSGGIETPIHNTDQSFAYNAVVSMAADQLDPTQLKSNYQLTVITETNMPINFMLAEGTIYAGSSVDLALSYNNLNQRYEFKPRAHLSGNMKIGVKLEGRDLPSSTAYQANKGISLGNVEFLDMVLETDAPYVSIREFRYSNDESNLVANFPIQLTKFQKYTSQDQVTGDVWTEVGFGINLFKEKIAGRSSFIIKSRYDQSTAKIKIAGLKLRDVAIKGRFPAVSVDGYLAFYEEGDIREISGGLAVDITNPAMNVEVNVLFAKNANFKYGFIDGLIELPNAGVPLGPVELYGGGLGVYWNMKPESFDSTYPVNTESASCRRIGNNSMMKYCPDNDIPFGMRLMAAITNPGAAATGESSFKARVFFEYAINRNFGINHIAIFGNGVIGGDFAKTNPAETDKEANDSYMREVAAENLGGESKTNNQADNLKKGKAVNIAVNNNVSPNPDPTAGPPSATISFVAGMMLDIPNKTFHLEAEVFLQADRLRGIGPYGRVGKAVIHADGVDPANSIFYIHVGRAAKPDRIGIAYYRDDTPNSAEIARIDAYLMIGNGVPAFPSPDADVVAFFPSLQSRFANGPSSTDLSDGQAFAFGASAKLGISAGGKRWYVDGLVSAGLDVLITNGSNCADEEGDWYGQGQVYGVVLIEAGVKNKRDTRRRRVLSAGAGIYAYINGLKPFGTEADVCIQVPRWISKQRKKCLGVEIGKVCDDPNSRT